MTSQTGTAFDVEALRRAVEERDAETHVGLFADDAEMIVVDRSNPPSSPLRLKGKAAIREFVTDIAGRDMSHRLENTVVGDASAAYTEACEYPDGTRVLCAAVLELDGGRIVRQVGVQAWDE